MKTADFWKNPPDCLYPPGYDAAREAQLWCAGWFLAVFWHVVGYGVRLAGAVMSLYEYSKALGRYVLLPYAALPPLWELWRHTWWGFALLAYATLLLAASHYRYYRQGSRMLYLLRRLPDRTLRHRRALGAPLLGLGVMALSMLALGLLDGALRALTSLYM